MGREVRRVPANWQHPKDELTGSYVPMFYRGFANAAREWDEARTKWERGEFPDYADDEDKLLPFDQWEGHRPCSTDYMPDWPESERTHLMMYEDTTEGTPISPAFETPEELAHWLADNKASAFGSDTATYEQWLRICRGGWAPSMVYSTTKGLQNGIEAMEDSP